MLSVVFVHIVTSSGIARINQVVGRAQVRHIYGAAQCAESYIACGKLNYEKRMLGHKQKLLRQVQVPGCAGA